MKEKELSRDTIDYLSKLALIDVNEEEKEEILTKLNKIINFFKKLDELDTSNIEPLRHPIDGLINVFREDREGNSLKQKEVLKNAKNTKEGYFKAPRIIKD